MNDNKTNPIVNSLITFSLIILVLFLDQYTKSLIIKNMPITVDNIKLTFSAFPPYEVTSWLWLKHVVNFGSANSIFNGKLNFIITFTSIVIISLFIFERVSWRNRTKVLSVSLGLIIAGGLGNLFDRVRLGYVTDFLALMNDEKVLWPIFNIADIAVNFGQGLFLFYFLFQRNKKVIKS